MDVVCTSGMMGQCMMVSGLRIKLTEKVIMFGLTVVNIKESGRKTICMVKEFTRGKMAVVMKANT